MSDHTGLVVGVMCADNHGLSGWWGGRVEPSSFASASMTSMQVDMHAYVAGLARIKHADALLHSVTTSALATTPHVQWVQLSWSGCRLAQNPND